MRKRLTFALLAIAALASVLAPSASAATEFGDNCLANESAEQEEGETLPTFFEFSAAADPLPVTAPISGVVTQWKLSVVPNQFSIPTTMKVLRVSQGSGSGLVVGESSGVVHSGTNVFDTRIPIQAGDRLGLLGTGKIGTLLCEVATKEARIGLGASVSPGNTFPFEEGESETRIPVSATVEPDADGDGFGDVTQDKCPQSAALQTPCPVITVDAVSLAGRASVTVLVATSGAAPVQVTGKVKLGKGKVATLTGPPQTVAAGELAHFKLKFPKKLEEKLKQLKPSQKLNLAVTASATNAIGQLSTDSASVKLKGQAK